MTGDQPHPREGSECKCGDPQCPVEGIMTMQEFKMHRPKLAAKLERKIGEGQVVLSVMPEYEDDVMFSACISYRIDGKHAGIMLCVKPTHLDAPEGSTENEWIKEER